MIFLSAVVPHRYAWGDELTSDSEDKRKTAGGVTYGDRLSGYKISICRAYFPLPKMDHRDNRLL
jgi:hypothetical protein